MRAAIYERYGSGEVVTIRDLERPPVGPDRVLIRVRAASANRSDWEALTGKPLYVRLSGVGLMRPKQGRLGSDIAGVVEEIGADVSDFAVGDEILGDILWHGTGGFAEYVSVPERAPLVLKPDGLSFEQAAAIPQGGGLALQAITERGEVEAGQHVLVLGAGGGAGTFAVQLAKARGAEVTGVDSARKLDLIRSLGADHALDYRADDFAKPRKQYDRIVDFAGKRSIFAAKRALRPRGSYAMVGGSMPRLIQTAIVGGIISKSSDTTMRVMMAKPNRDDLTSLAQQVAAGELASVIDRTYPLSDVAEALDRLGPGDALGKLVITV